MTEEENTTQEPEDTTKVDLGKFQNVDALMRAYKELEAEFTRRSQRLRAPLLNRRRRSRRARLRMLMRSCIAPSRGTKRCARAL